MSNRRHEANYSRAFIAVRGAGADAALARSWGWENLKKVLA
jgi:hypothetical protein